MATTSQPRACDRKGCASAATKHLTYVERGRVAGTTIIRPVHHRNFCDEHAQEARDHFGGSLQDIDAPCAPECPNNS